MKHQIPEHPVLDENNRRVLIVLALAGLVYFGLFFFPNRYGAATNSILEISSPDEFVTYPIVVRMLTPGQTFNETRANLFLYEDYHYGYLFYALSAVILLPVRLIFGLDFTHHMQLNLLLLRQFISVLPMILAAGLLVYLQTRFQSVWKSVALFLFLLTIRGVVRNHIWWWHPDALAVLCVVLTIFFLDRDRLQFGRYFYLSSLACGVSIAIKLLGLFFILTIPTYLVLGLVTRRISLRKSVLSALLFLVLMTGTVIGSNPFLFSAQQRERLVVIQTQKQEELSQGYEHDDPLFYQKGPQWWSSTLEKWYGHPLFLGFLLGCLVAGCFWGQHRLLNLLILTWVVPYSVYLLYFVAVKPDHYWLPVILPLFSAALIPMDFLSDAWRRTVTGQALRWQTAALILVGLILVGQFGLQLARDVSGNIPLYQSFMTTGIAQVLGN